jgi:hypothetical protein
VKEVLENYPAAIDAFNAKRGLVNPSAPVKQAEAAK